MSVDKLSNADESSTKVITVAIVDDLDAAATPNNMYWTLTDRFGSPVNSRVNVDYQVDDGSGSAGTLSSSMQIILTGDDLIVHSKTKPKLLTLAVHGTYNSSTGSNLKYTGSCLFQVDNILSIRIYKPLLGAGTLTLLGSAATFTVA